MGSEVSCASCTQRDHEVSPVNPMCQSPAEMLIMMLQRDKTSTWRDEELKSQIAAVVSKSMPKQAAHLRVDSVNKSRPACSRSHGLQDQINAIVGAHAESLRQQRLSMALPSTCPTSEKSIGDLQVEYYSNTARAQAGSLGTTQQCCDRLKESRQVESAHRSAAPPGFFESESKSHPGKTVYVDGETRKRYGSLEKAWSVYNKNMEENHGKAQGSTPTTAASMPLESNLMLTSPSQQKTDDPKLQSEKLQTAPFDINEIPSPTRNRAKRRTILRDTAWIRADTAAREEVSRKPQQILAEDEQFLARVRLRIATEDKQKRSLQQLHSAVDGVTKSVEMQAKWLQEYDQKVEIAARDKLCVDTFVESVKKCAWQESVRKPIEGNTLPAIHEATSTWNTHVDIKDSSFGTFRSFLTFLESEGLLSLVSGLSHPVVINIDFDACLRYNYDSQRQEQLLGAVADAIVAVDGSDSHRKYKNDCLQQTRFLATLA